MRFLKNQYSVKHWYDWRTRQESNLSVPQTLKVSIQGQTATNKGNISVRTLILTIPNYLKNILFL